MENITFGSNIEEFIKQKKEPKWMIKKRLEAWDLFLTTPNPTERDEKWRYTNIENINMSEISAEQPDGLVELEKDLPSNVILTDMKTALQKHPDIVKQYFTSIISPSEDKFNMLHTALWSNGAFLYVPENTEIEKPIHINFSSEGSFFTHSLIIAEDNSKVTALEKHVSGTTPNIRTGFVELIGKPGSNIDFYTIQNLRKSYEFSNKTAMIDNNSTVNILCGYFGGIMSRVIVNALLNGEGAHGNTRGVFYGRGTQHFDITTNAYHNVPNTTNDILVNGVLDNNSTSIYRGLIKILKGAQQTNSYLSDHTLKLSKESVANSVPSLEIDANDVKASHSATISQIDDSQLFYLMSRGLSKKCSEKMIVNGFCEKVLETIKLKEVKDKFIQEIIDGNSYEKNC